MEKKCFVALLMVAVLQDESFFSYMRKIKPWIDA